MTKLQRFATAPAVAALSAVLLLGFTGCKSQPAAPDDNTLASSIQTRFAADNSLTGTQIQTAVQDGIVTLSGSVANDAQRELAARDAAMVPGSKTIVNNLTVQAAAPTVAAVTPAPAPVAPVPVPEPARIRKPLPIPPPKQRHNPAPIEQSYNQAPPPPMPAPQPQAPSAPLPPPPPPQPVFKNFTLEPGTTIPVRITQTLDSATTQQGDSFSGSVASDIVVDGVVAIPQGAGVSGRVDVVQEAGHFKGNSLLTVSLNTVRRMSISTEPYSVEGKGRGKNTAEKAGIGAVGGAILGGIFGGGKGAAIGAAAGGGTGVGINAVTRGQQVQIPSETIVRFRTTTPLTVKIQVGGPRQGGDNELPHRNQQ
jgi:hypothetical protein